MRRYHLLSILCLTVLLSCSDDSPLDDSKPTLPASPSPADESADQPSSLTLAWSGMGGDHFDVYLGTTTSPPRVAHDLTVSHYHPARLTTGVPYYWRVVNVGASGGVEGPLWTFSTRPGVPPISPSQPGPADGVTVALDPVDLTWSPAPGDSLTFNVYFGSETDPPLVTSDLAVATYSASVIAGNTYYWRVEAKNLDQLATSSPVWHFQADYVPGHMYNVAGTGEEGFGPLEGQVPLDTRLFLPQDVAFDADGNLVVVDWNNHRVLELDPVNGWLNLIAGSPDGKPGEPCAPYPASCTDTQAPETRLNHPTSVTFMPDGRMAMAAWHNMSMFVVDVAAQTMTRVAGTGKQCYDGEEKPANEACVWYPSASVVDLQGRLVFTDQADVIIRMIDANGIIHRIAGTAPIWNGTRWVPQQGFSGDEGPATLARFKWDIATTCGKLAIDRAGNIYVADTYNHAVRVIDTSGVIHRFAGLYPANAGFSGDGGAATAAQLTLPRDVACDGNGNVFIADAGNHVIRMVTPQGIISTVAGTPGVTGGSQDDGRLATQSGLNLPFGIDIDPHGNLWIADTQNNRIRVVYR